MSTSIDIPGERDAPQFRSRGGGFAVLDVETTGLKLGWHHRVVEIAIVALSPAGQVTDRWSTLVNPQRDMGPQHIHGIRAADAARAPTFTDLAGDIIVRLAGRVVVGHNIGFDLGHIAEEFRRCALPIECRSLPTLCTMSLARSYLVKGSGRSLSAICRELGVGHAAPHTAAGDAEATAAVFAAFLGRDHGLLTPELAHVAKAIEWPDLPRGLVAPIRRPDAGQQRPHWLAEIVDRLPRVEDPEVDRYLAVLDRVVLDRYIDLREAEQLIELAWSLGLHRSDAVALHHGYLHAVAREALADHVVTPTERSDLVRLALALALPEHAVDDALSNPQDLLAEFRPAGRLRLRAGMTVVITGDTNRGKAYWAELLSAVGVKVERNVTARTALVVAADLDTASGKGRLARERGLPIIDEDHLVELYDEVCLEPA